MRDNRPNRRDYLWAVVILAVLSLSVVTIWLLLEVAPGVVYTLVTIAMAAVVIHLVALFVAEV